MQRIRAAAMAAAFVLGALGCAEGNEGREFSAAAQRGRGVYLGNCAACHALDPNQDGALGPAVAGSSRELIEARVLRAEYPPDHAPKRSSNTMVALPHLASDVDDLHAYLSEVALP